MSKMDVHLCWWPVEHYDTDYDYEYEYEYDGVELWSWTAPQWSSIGGIFWKNSGPRILSEVIPHYTQCILTLVIAIERFILICHPTRAKQLLSRKKRIVSYVLITALLLGLCSFLSYHYLILGQDFWYERENKFDNVFCALTLRALGKFLGICPSMNWPIPQGSDIEIENSGK